MAAAATEASSNVSDDQYLLGRSYRAATRLNVQHYQWRETTGANVHPSIPALSQGARVADVATGTGIWALEVADGAPDGVQFDCLDIDLAQMPAAGWLPANMRARQWDLLTPPPADLVGKFDLVHIRLVLVVIPNNDATQAARHLRALLKPGGYLQWGEVDPHRMAVTTVNPARKGNTPAAEAMLAALGAPGRMDWVGRVPDTLRATGFEDVKVHEYQLPPSMLRSQMDQLLMLWEEIAAGLARSKGPEAARHVLDIVCDAAVEAADGVALCATVQEVVARKPLE